MKLLKFMRKGFEYKYQIYFGAIILIQTKQMFGRHYDTRVESHYVKIYSKVPYLDTQIFNIQAEGLRESRRTRNRTQRALSGIERAKQKSQKLEEGLRNSRLRQQEQDQKFIDDIKESQRDCMEKEKITWTNFTADKAKSRVEAVRDQKYLEGLLATNSTLAASRLTSVRRWH